MDDIDFGSKYDRQIRLWNSNGQNSLSNSKICIININTLSSEILKNLILSGVGSIVIIDSTKVLKSDISTNFYLTEKEIGFNKSDAIAGNLKLLNLDIEIKSLEIPLSDLTIENNENIKFWSSFNCVIISEFGFDFQLYELLWNLNIPLIKTLSVGFYSYLRIQLKQQTIIETHNLNNNDLRIDKPWIELQNYIDSIDLLNNNDYFKIPYSIILTKLYQSFKNDNDNINPKISDIRNLIKLLYKSGDEINLNEAYNKASLIMKNSTELTNDLKEIFNNSQTNELNKSSSIFWIMCNSLKSFYENFNLLPITGILPDMESDSLEYMKLKNIYTEKFLNDKKILKDKILNILTKFDRVDEINDLNFDNLLDLFIKNCKFLKVINGSKIDKSNDILNIFEFDNENFSNKSIIYLAFMICGYFYLKNKTFPIDSNKSQLRSMAISILCNYKDLTAFPDGLDKVLDEICRSNSHELHNVSSIMGGIAAQEIIKILTNQYIPLDNCIVFDGISGKTLSFKV